MDHARTRQTFVCRFLKWLFYIFVGLVVVIGVILIFFKVSATSREVKLSSDVAPATGHFVQTFDAKIFVQESGPMTGQPVLLIPGTGAWSEIWRDTIDPLATAGYRVIAIDLPPFGFSEKLIGVSKYSRENQAKRIIGILDVLGIHTVILVGHSVGARPTIEAALENPERVAKLVLVDPALGFQEDKEDTPHFEQNHPSFIVHVLFGIDSLRNAILSVYGTNPISIKPLVSSFVFQKSAITDARVAMLQRGLVIKDVTQANGDWLEYLTVRTDTSLSNDFTNFKKLTMPVGILWGREDTVTPLWQGEALKKLIPNSQLVVLDNVGHIPFIEDTNSFNLALFELLKK
ncbi:MAG: alpha/beta hydrolase [Patescibacteria group bacterium]